jgi:5'-nucleotidase
VRALVTNDDGIDTAGLLTLASVAIEAGLEVTVAAPHMEFSGASASLTALEGEGRLIVHERPLEGLGAVRALGVEAAPAFITFAALHGAFGPRPDLVLSGVNHGPNTGHAVLHSGTVGAALTGATYGCRGLAVSMATAGAPAHLETAAEMARRSVAWLAGAAPKAAFVLSINVPDVPLQQLRGLRSARLAAFGAVQASVAEVGEGFVRLSIAPVEEDYAPGTDAALLLDSWATATALSGPCEATSIDLSSLAEPAEDLPSNNA